MNAFLWDTNYVTGLTEVDEQHHFLVELINQFSALLEKGAQPNLAELERLCEELSAYARHHFSEEQKFMDRLGVDPRHVAHHVREHADFFLDLARMRTEVSAGMPDAARHLLEFLVHWLAAHILGSDQSMARQIAAMAAGRTPAEAFALEERAVNGATGILLKSLSGLTMVVSERSRELFELNRSLEGRVFERTRELSVANERLSRAVARLQAEQQETRRLSQELMEANRNLEARAMVDRLTGLPNLQYALTRFQAEIASANHFGHPLSLALFAPDGFKQVNDTLGPEAGDDLIKAVGALLQRCFRPHDVVCHVGVEEFLVICPHTSHVGTILLTDPIREALPGMVVQVGTGQWQGSLSVGIAELGPELDTIEKLIQAATLRRRPLEV